MFFNFLFYFVVLDIALGVIGKAAHSGLWVFFVWGIEGIWGENGGMIEIFENLRGRKMK